LKVPNVGRNFVRLRGKWEKNVDYGTIVNNPTLTTLLENEFNTSLS